MSAAWLAIAVALSTPAADPARLGKEDEPRVRTARAEYAEKIRGLFEAAEVPYPAHALLLRVFKREGTVELWASPGARRPYVRLKDYPVCASSGGPGPKREEGDGQVPEGFYAISGFNPASAFWLSMRVDYPNTADRRRNKAPRLGGDIFIHGSCVTVGCVPLTDAGISELYVIARDTARAGGKVDAHLFPMRLDDSSRAALEQAAAGDAALLAFWDELRPGYQWFEAHRTLPPIKVDGAGRYRIGR